MVAKEEIRAKSRRGEGTSLEMEMLQQKERAQEWVGERRIRNITGREGGQERKGQRNNIDT